MQHTNSSGPAQQLKVARRRGRPRRASRGNEAARRQVAIVPQPTPVGSIPPFLGSNTPITMPTPGTTSPQDPAPAAPFHGNNNNNSAAQPTQHHQPQSSPPRPPQPPVPAASPYGGSTDALGNAVFAEAFNGLIKRVRQLEHDNARLKKRQRKHRDALRELRSLGRHQASDRCRPPQPSPPGVVDRVVVQHFPFLWDYDLRGRPFVGADPRKPTLVCSFAGPLQARPMFVNPQWCRLLGHSQEELLFCDPRMCVILVPDKTWLLHRLLFGNGEPMSASGIVYHHAEMMQRTGHMVDARVSAQFFYGPTGQLRCTVLCVEEVLRVRCPPWAQEEGAHDDDEQHQQKLELYSDQLQQRAELEWAQFRDAPQLTAASTTAVGAPDFMAPLQAQPSLEWDKDFFSPAQVCL